MSQKPVKLHKKPTRVAFSLFSVFISIIISLKTTENSCTVNNSRTISCVDDKAISEAFLEW